MQIIQFDPLMFLGILPEVGLVVLAGLVLVLDLIWKGEQRRNLAWVVVIGLLLAGTASVFFGRPYGGANYLIFGGMLRWDMMHWIMSLVIYFGGAITVLLAKDLTALGKEGEFYFLLLVAMLGMSLMTGATNLVMVFLAIETTSIPMYILAGFFRRDEPSAEAGFKYLLYGAATSAVMLYGFSLIYGLTGTTQLYSMQAQFANSQISAPFAFIILILVLVGLFFKISAVPMHFWAPDVYQGAPTPVAGFLSTASKAAGFIVLLRFLTIVFGDLYPVWSPVICVVSAASMLFGNLQAMRQHNIKRLLAYSSIAQAGYILIGVASITVLGFLGIVVYLIAYMVTNLAAFGVISIIGNQVKSDEINAYSGLARKSSGLGLGLLAAFLSLAGIPPFAGFVGKIFLFSSAILDMGNPWLVGLVILGVLNSILALYYYLRVVRIVYQGEPETKEPVVLTRPMKIAVSICVAGILIVGVFFAPLFTAAGSAVQSLFQ